MICPVVQKLALDVRHLSAVTCHAFGAQNWFRSLEASKSFLPVWDVHVLCVLFGLQTLLSSVRALALGKFDVVQSSGSK